MSIRDRILSTSDIDSEELFVPQWECTILIRGMSGRERARFVQMYADGDGKIAYEKLYPELCIMGVRDPETGEAVFSEADADLLLDKSGSALELISTAVLRVSGLADKAVDLEARDFSSPIPSVVSTTD